MRSEALAGQSIVISGTFAHHSREEYKEIIEACGGKNVSSISSKTSFILAGDNMGPSKQEKARQLGIPLVSEAEFLDMIGERNENENENQNQNENENENENQTNSAPQQLTLFD